MRISPSISPRNLRIAGASLVAVLMVAGGYFLPGFKFPKTRTVDAALTDDLLASYVAKDTDGDGLPDWQEVLYGTDINKADTNGDGISDGEAVKRGLLTPTALASQIPADPIGKDEPLPGQAPTAGSMTDQFARSFFQAYMEQSGGQPMTADAQQTLIDQLLTDFNARGARALASSYTTLSIRTNANASEEDYAAAIVKAIQENATPEGSDPPVLMQALMEQKDESARTKLIAIGKADAAVAHDLLTVPVPPALADEHLRLIRSLDTLSKATPLVANYDKDPVGAMSALALYAPTSQEFLKSIEDIATEMVRGGEPADGTSEAFVVGLARALQAQGI